MQKKECHTFKYIKLLFANICFCNYAYLEGYDYNVISKLPNEVDERKYLDQFNKVDAEDIKSAIGISDKDYNNIVGEENKQENNEGVIQSEIYGVSHGQFVEMKKTNQNNINTNNKTTSTGTNTNKPDNKKNAQPAKKSNVQTKTNNFGSKNTKGNYGTSKYGKGKTGKK